MDSNYREFARRHAAEFVPTEEIIRRRQRAGACVVCGERSLSRCSCIGVYLYKDQNDEFRLRRDQRSTLPFAIITSVLLEGKIEALKLNQIKGEATAPGSRPKFPNNKEITVELGSIVDLDIAVRGEVDIEDGEKRVLTAYLTALEHASDLGIAVDE